MKATLPDLSQLLSEGKKAGYVTYGQLNRAIPPDVREADLLEGIISRIQKQGIEIIDEEDAEERGLLLNKAKREK
ncbi:MAG: hypothetical protein CMJ90_15725, partial [Planctomycetes bacterium]|nr:hypothetical protein [Planctomycetota bacterium]